VSGPVFVTDTGSSKGNDSYTRENLVLVEINVCDTSQSTSQTNTSDIEQVQTSLSAELLEIVGHIGTDGSPHIVVGLLNFTVLTGMLIDYLQWIEDILPNIQGCVGIAEGQHNEFVLDGEDTLDVNLVLFDVVCMDWSV